MSLPEKVAFCQDWEYEVTNAGRLEEFMDYYQHAVLDAEEKFARMIIILSSFDDALTGGHAPGGAWERIRRCLTEDIDIHGNTIHYWALHGEELEDGFAVTPYIRTLD
ncbi:hypothetical protein [Paenibacillus mucilaginosus]|uniref:hypothetical protein n=1 Tax=Paenibacillus mucilaginosus TaxID=61624 RepID=UPI003D1CFA5F